MPGAEESKGKQVLGAQAWLVTGCHPELLWPLGWRVLWLEGHSLDPVP